MIAPSSKGGWVRLRKLFSRRPAERAEFVELIAQWLETKDQFLPHSRDELIELLGRVRTCRELFDGNALGMLEGVLQLSDLTVKDILIPNTEVTKLTVTDSLDDIIRVVVEQGHSRYPVFDGKEEKVVGVLLAKDLLRHVSKRDSFSLERVMRQPVFEPMSKRLDVLLKEFKNSKNHMVIAVDEYDTHAGLVTIEDVLERIVGRISDEYDDEEDENIYELKKGQRWRVKGLIALEEFNSHFGTSFGFEDVDTLGGWLASQFGTVPNKGESVSKDGLKLYVHSSNSRRILEVEVVRLSGGGETEPPEERR